MNRLLDAGNDVVTECYYRRIQGVYAGVMSVTRTIAAMKHDERNGGHHRLRK